MIVDCHAHLLPPRRSYKLIEWTKRFSPAHPVPLEATLDALVAEYRALGISRIWNFAHAIFPDEPDRLNEWNRQITTDHPEIVPLGTWHPETPDPLGIVDRCLGEHGFIGMKFHPFVQKFVPWEPRYFPIWERMAARGGLVVFHTGFEDFYSAPMPLSGFETIVRALPELVVVLAHANYPRVAEAFELVARYPNVYVDTALLFGPLVASWDAGGVGAARGALRDGIAAFPDRVMFGTDHPSGPGTLGDMYGDFARFDLPAATHATVAGLTALRLETDARRRLAQTRSAR